MVAPRVSFLRKENLNNEIPFLLFTSMEGLSKKIYSAAQTKWVSDFHVDRRGIRNLNVTHISYADDSMSMCDADEHQVLIPEDDLNMC